MALEAGMRGLLAAAGAGRTILAPSTELAAALHDAVARAHAAAGRKVWPTADIHDFGGWLRRHHAERQLTDAALPRVLTDFEERELWRALILGGTGGGAFLEPAGAARAALRARRAMAEYGIPMRRLAGYATAEAQALVEWDGAFRALCAERRCVSAADLIDAAVAPAAAGIPRGIVWIESPLWRPAARRWLAHHAAGPLAPDHHATPPFDSTGLPTARGWRAASPDTELAAIAEWARAGLAGNRRFRAWVCLPDLTRRRSAVVDAFDAALAPQRFAPSAGDMPANYAVAGGTPLADYSPVRTALDTLSAAAGGPVSFAAFSALLRRPELQASAAEMAAAAMLDVQLRRRGPHAAELHAWLSLSDDLLEGGGAPPVAAVRRLQAALRILAGGQGALPLSRWVVLWMEAFRAGPWALRQSWSSMQFQAAERFRELLAALATADGLLGRRSAPSAARLLVRAARDTAFQPQTGIPPIWVSGQVTDPWLTYDGLWIAGCGEDRWPPPLDPLPLLPVPLQREYGVIPASFAAQLQHAEDLQRRWRRRAAASVFSCADPGDGRAAALSPLLDAAAALDAALPPTRPHWQILAEHAPLLDSLWDEHAPPFAEPERTRGVATLRAQSRCAFRGFAETRLRTEVLDQPAPGFDPRERGDMLHHALEFLWSELRTSARLAALPPEALSELVAVSVAEAIAEQCRRRDPGPRWRAREILRLNALLREWLAVEGRREPFEVERLEQDAQTARHGGIEFKVRIDRMDRLADGGRVLIDYKTGAAAPDWRGERPDNPQLPVYALRHPDSLVAVAYGRISAGDSGFVAETARGSLFKPRGRPTGLEGMPDFAALVALWSRRMEKIAGEFAAGHAEVAPTLHACEHCGLQSLCRVPTGLDV